jgi:hypothetical protein
MKRFFKKNEAEVYTLIGLLLILHHFLSNGFKCRTSDGEINSAETFIYGAWGDVPFKYNNTF